MTKILKISSLISSVIILSCAVSLYFLPESEQKTEKNIASDTINGGGIKVAVFNGCGRPGIATTFSNKLREMGFDVVNGNGENAESFDFTKSVVVDRKNDRLKAERAAESLGIDIVMHQYSYNQYIIEDIAVIIGRDWDTLKTNREVESD